MNNLADAVLDYLWFLNFSEEGEADIQVTSDLLGNLLTDIDRGYSEIEKQALMDAAKRRLADWLRAPDEHGYTPRKLLTSDKRQFLEEIAAGQFIDSDDGEEDDND